VKVSIITVVFNRAGTVADALASLYAQSYADFEHVVQDGGSTDGTLAVLDQFSDPRMQLVSERDGGIYDGLNRAMARCRGEYVGLIHSDDMFAHPDVLANAMERLERTGADALYGDLDYVSAADPARVIRRWRSGAFRPALLKRGWMPPHPTLFVRRSLAERLGHYDTRYRIAADYDAMIRWFSSDGFSATYLPETMVKMRVGGESNKSLRKVIRKMREDYRIAKAHRLGGAGVVLSKNLSKLGQFLGE
jgi:glycosyltransferase involved in cell wall biosynthesis